MNDGVPLLLAACLGGEFGRVYGYDGGAMCDAGFIYLAGRPDAARLAERMDMWRERAFVCVSGGWEHALTAAWPELGAFARHQMTMPGAPDADALRALTRVPEGYALRPFDAEAFARQPFGHGRNYADWADFARHGAGAVVWQGGDIVASASSFITYGGAAELDVSTLPEHRGRGLGKACAAAMMLDCAERGISVHWDAQNAASRHMALRLGYDWAYDYNMYAFAAPGQFEV